MTQKLLLIASALVLFGCASPQETATFVTKTSFSLVDVDSTPASVSIAYDRIEGYVGPRFVDGSVFPVASVLETRGTGFDRAIKQVYATGEAARIVTAMDPPAGGSGAIAASAAAASAAIGGAALPPAGAASAAGGGSATDNKVMFFGTGTVVGLKIGFLDGTPLPSSFVLGYKRKELSVIPVDKDRQPSVIATFDNTAGVTQAPGAARADAKFEIEQYFATGEAATNLAGMPSIRDRFQQKAVRALGDIEKFRNEEALQGRLALNTLNCFVKVPDDKLDLVWNNAEALGVFGDLGTIVLIRKKPGRKEQRDLYVGDLSLLNPGYEEHTQLLTLHKKAVCNLNKPTN